MAALTAAVGAAAEVRPLIAHVVYRFAVGGLENGVVNLINQMDASRWRHMVVSLTDIDPTFAERVKPFDVVYTALHKPPGQGLWLYPALWRLFRHHRPAIVHTRNLAALEAQLPAWLAGVSGRVHGEHGRDIEDLHGTSRRHIAMRRLYRPFVQQTIALGQELLAYSRDRVGVPAHRLLAVYNGVDTARFKPAPTRVVIPGCPFTDPALWLAGWVGRMQTAKAPTALARAFVSLLAQAPSLATRLRLVMVGDGPLRAECQSILESAGVAHLAWLPGERNDVPDVMRGLNCFVLPSLGEGISNTILEAMSCGLPVLATRVGANAELVVEGSTGALVPAGDEQALADGLLRLASDAQAAAAMGRAGRQRVEQRYSLQAMVSAYEAVYRRLLPQPGVN